MRHVVGLSGGEDSTVLAFMLKEREPETDWTYICTPTGDEGPEMVDHWIRLEEALGKPLIRITNPKAPDLDSLIDIQKIPRVFLMLRDSAPQCGACWQAIQGCVEKLKP